MKFINSWNAPRKQWDKFDINIRLFGLTIFRFYFDVSDIHCELVICNFGLRSKR